MRTLRLTLSLLLVMITVSGAFAQKTKLRRANTFFDQKAYNLAIPVYLDILEKRDVAEAKVSVAECYRKIGNWGEAEYWYGQIVRLPDAKPDFNLFYGMALQSNGKCDLAVEWFQEYIRLAPDDLRGHQLLKACGEEAREKMNKTAFYEITHLPPTINTSFDDFGPMPNGDGLVYASERSEGGARNSIHTWTGHPFLDLYISKVDTLDAEKFELDYKKPEKYSAKLNTKYHDGPIAFTDDQSVVYFTRNNLFKGKTGRDDNGIVRLKIYSAELSGSKWKNETGLPFNSDEYSVAHPTLNSAEKKLYFSSDMPGGFGGMDLYVSTFEGGRWSPPINLGPRINTEGNEIFPYYHSSTKKLYFSSDAHVSMGGLDIFFVQQTSNEQFGPVMNVGYPVNTESDDFGLTINEKETFGYFCSDREGGVGGDDIYSFKRLAVTLEVLVYDENTGDPIEGSTVLESYSGSSLITDKDGITTIELPIDKCLTLKASKDTYVDNELESCTKGYEPGTKVFVKIPLGKPVEFEIEGVVLNSKTKEPLQDATVTLISLCGADELTATTDETGEYKFTLEKDCCYKVKGTKEMYLADVPEDEHCTKGLKKSKTFTVDLELTPTLEIANPLGKTGGPNGGPGTNGGPGGGPNGGPGGGIPPDGEIVYIDGKPMLKTKTGELIPLKPVNFVLEHIYYDFNKANIREDAVEGLEKLIVILNDNPDIVVEIGSHTDSRGSDKYNARLSARRAASVVKYLIVEGIDKNRLVAKGYGEEATVNDCEDNVPCEEEDHQRNRRTEFRVVGSISGGTYTETYSAPPAKVKTDKCENCPF